MLASLQSPAPAQPRLIVVDPGHFHASLLQREMYPALAPRVTVYAPLGPEVLDYLNRISLFNSRQDNPTRWEMDVHLSAQPMKELLAEKPGNVVLFTGRNRGKIDRILAALEAGQHVFADKPWIITSADLPKLERALQLARDKHLAAYDIMTERYEVTSELQRVFVNTPEVFGHQKAGNPSSPGIEARSVHHLMKVVAGVPLRRPTWFFDVEEYGEGLADVGTHVVDLVQWTAFPDQPIDYGKDLRLVAAKHWPVTLTPEQFQQVTGSPLGPPRLDYFANNAVSYTLRGVHVKLDILWNWEAPPGAGDVYEATFRGSLATIEIRQGAAEKHLPELYVVPADDAHRPQVLAALHAKVAALQGQWPGLSVQVTGQTARLVIPNRFRVGHEAHFAQVANHFFAYLQSPASMPAWEAPNMLAKYYVSTKGVELAKP